MYSTVLMLHNMCFYFIFMSNFHHVFMFAIHLCGWAVVVCAWSLATVYVYLYISLSVRPCVCLHVHIWGWYSVDNGFRTMMAGEMEMGRCDDNKNVVMKWLLDLLCVYGIVGFSEFGDKPTFIIIEDFLAKTLVNANKNNILICFCWNWTTYVFANSGNGMQA